MAQFTKNDIACSIPISSATTGTTTTGISFSNASTTTAAAINATNSVANMIKSTAKRSTSFCEPKRRTSTCLTKQLPSITNQQQQKREEQMVARLDNRRINLYTASNVNNEKQNTPAPAKSSNSADIAIATDIQQVHENTDEAIDPRAEVVVAIGNNMFPVEHRNEGNTTAIKNRSPVVRSKSKRRSTMNNAYHDQADMEEAFSDSIKGLLKELGVHQQPSSTTVGDKVRRRKSVNQQQQQLQQQRHSINTEHNNNAVYVNTAPTTTTTMFGNSNPMIMTPTGIPMTANGNSMIWARALYDYYSERPEDLSFNRGQWLAIIHNNDQQWWLAHKWDDATGRLSETCGYVASNFVQIC